jgi:hypothetical protein
MRSEQSSRRVALAAAVTGLAPGVVVFMIIAIQGIIHTACLEELAAELATSAGIFFTMGTAPLGLLARVLLALRPRKGLAHACRGLAWANAIAFLAVLIGLVYDRFLGGGAPGVLGAALLAAFVPTAVLLVSVPSEGHLSSVTGWRRAAWIGLGVLTVAGIAVVGALIWLATHIRDDRPAEPRMPPEASTGKHSAAPPLVRAYLGADPVTPIWNPEITPAELMWSKQIDLAGVTVTVSARCCVGQGFVAMYSDETSARLMFAPGDYVYPRELRVAIRERVAYGRASGLAGGVAQVTKVFAYDLERRHLLDSAEVDPALLPPAREPASPRQAR